MEKLIYIEQENSETTFEILFIIATILYYCKLLLRSLLPAVRRLESISFLRKFLIVLICPADG